MSDSQIRQNFHKECEDAINRQINMELYASYVYLSMVSHLYTCIVFVCLIGVCSSDACINIADMPQGMTWKEWF